MNIFLLFSRSGIMVHTCNPSLLEDGTDGLLVQGQLGLHSEVLSQQWRHSCHPVRCATASRNAVHGFVILYYIVSWLQWFQTCVTWPETQETPFRRNARPFKYFKHKQSLELSGKRLLSPFYRRFDWVKISIVGKMVELRLESMTPGLAFYQPCLITSVHLFQVVLKFLLYQ